MAQEVDTIEHSAWSGTEEVFAAFVMRDLTINELAGVRTVYVNDLDVQADISVYLTDDLDTVDPGASGSRATAAVTLDNDSTTKTLSANGGWSDDMLTETFSRVVVGVTPNTNPSSGSFRLIADA